MIIVFIFLFFSLNNLYSIEWSKNNIIKFKAKDLKEYNYLKDYENIEVNDEIITINENGFLYTDPIIIEQRYFPTAFFISFKDTDSVILEIEIWDNNFHEMLTNFRINKSASYDLRNIYSDNISIFIRSIYGIAKIFSYGLVQNLKIISREDYILSYPPLIFFNEDSLNINFFLRFSSFVDVFIFNNKGEIVKKIFRNKYFSYGINNIELDNNTFKDEKFQSGLYYIYFKFLSVNGITEEFVKQFEFVR